MPLELPPEYWNETTGDSSQQFGLLLTSLQVPHPDNPYPDPAVFSTAVSHDIDTDFKTVRLVLSKVYNDGEYNADYSFVPYCVGVLVFNMSFVQECDKSGCGQGVCINGQCVCDTGWSKDKSPNATCTACDQGYAGPNCAPCPGFDGVHQTTVCSGYGNCTFNASLPSPDPPFVPKEGATSCSCGKGYWGEDCRCCEKGYSRVVLKNYTASGETSGGRTTVFACLHCPSTTTSECSAHGTCVETSVPVFPTPMPSFLEDLSGGQQLSLLPSRARSLESGSLGLPLDKGRAAKVSSLLRGHEKQHAQEREEGWRQPSFLTAAKKGQQRILLMDGGISRNLGDISASEKSEYERRLRMPGETSSNGECGLSGNNDDNDDAAINSNGRNDDDDDYDDASSYSCQCDPALHFTGSACSECVSGWAPPGCVASCPLECSGRGNCSAGSITNTENSDYVVYQNLSCACPSSFNPESFCANCTNDYFGTECEHSCPGNK